MKQFPDYTWRALQERMDYHHGLDWKKAYTGHKQYHRDLSWSQILAETGMANTSTTSNTVPQLDASYTYTDTCTTLSFHILDANSFSYLRLIEIVARILKSLEHKTQLTKFCA